MRAAGVACSYTAYWAPAFIPCSLLMRRPAAARAQLEGPLPPLPESLWVADLTANGFTGQLPPLNALPNLEAFLVGGNAFEGALPPLPPALAVLDASYNRLSGGRRPVGTLAAGPALSRQQGMLVAASRPLKWTALHV